MTRVAPAEREWPGADTESVRRPGPVAAAAARMEIPWERRSEVEWVVAGLFPGGFGSGPKLHNWKINLENNGEKARNSRTLSILHRRRAASPRKKIEKNCRVAPWHATPEAEADRAGALTPRPEDRGGGSRIRGVHPSWNGVPCRPVPENVGGGAASSVAPFQPRDAEVSCRTGPLAPLSLGAGGPSRRGSAESGCGGSRRFSAWVGCPTGRDAEAGGFPWGS